MMRRLARLGLDDGGAVAPTVALSLIGLIAVAGIAFDYAHMATLDTELQTAADQAALAAASQLDGEDGACERAVAAAQTLLTNQTLMANDGNGLAVTVADSSVCTSDTEITDDVNAGVRFFVDKLATDPAENNEEAHFVQVTVNTRRANYALTPIVGVFSSGDLGASALAGMGTALCKVPPLMICPPAGTIDWAAMRGHGIKAVAQNGQSWAPGDFGYIGPQDAGSTQKGLAYQNPIFQCQAINGSDTVSSGAPAPAITAINTRFDIYDIASGAGNTLNPCLGTACPPAVNVTKDYVRQAGAGKCGLATNHANQVNNEQWHLIETVANRFFPRAKNASDTAMTQIDQNGVIDAMGLPRDNCHFTSYNSACAGGRFGDGTWARGDYFNKYHSGRIPLNASTMTRYETYRWEIDNGYIPSGTASGNDRQEGTAVCNTTVPDATRDRRVLQVAVGSNCGSLHGASTPVQIGEWVDFFLVQPGSKPPGRGNGDPGNEIYLEVIGPVTPGGNAAQIIRRDVPYLVR